MPKAMVIPYKKSVNMNSFFKDMMYKIFGRKLRKLHCKRKANAIIDTCSSQLFYFLIKATQQRRLIVRLQHFTGMHRKRDNSRGKPPTQRLRFYLFNKMTVPYMDAIKKTNGSNKCQIRYLLFYT